MGCFGLNRVFFLGESHMARNDTNPLVSVIIPTRNEAGFIERNIRSVLENDYPTEQIEIVVVDGMSDDGTGDIVTRLAERDDRIRLIENPRRITPVAFNLGINASMGEIIFIIGGHSSVPKDFIRKSVQTLLEHPEAWCVGGAIETINDNYIGGVISAAMSTPVGVGNARFRLGNYQGYVDTVTFPCYWRWVFDKIGMFDEQLVRNQDDDFNLRLILAGGKIYMDSNIRSNYYARGSLRKLAKQYFQYGFWRIRTIQKHSRPATLRQLAPLVLVCIWLALIIGTLICRPIGYGLLGFAWLYLLGLLVGTLDVARKAGWRYAPLAPAVFAILHFCYGLGGLKGIWSFCILHRGGKINVEKVPLSR